jgi:hypothetical protein
MFWLYSKKKKYESMTKVFMVVEYSIVQRSWKQLHVCPKLVFCSYFQIIFFVYFSVVFERITPSIFVLRKLIKIKIIYFKQGVNTQLKIFMWNYCLHSWQLCVCCFTKKINKITNKTNNRQKYLHFYRFCMWFFFFFIHC